MRPSDLSEVVKSGDRHTLYGAIPTPPSDGTSCDAGVMLERQDLAQPIDPAKKFDKKDYDAKCAAARCFRPFHPCSPHLYKPVCHENVAPYLTALVNCMYWESRFPRLLTNQV